MWPQQSCLQNRTGHPLTAQEGWRGAKVRGPDSCFCAQFSLTFPGVTHTQINPQDAGSSVTVKDSCRLSRKKPGRWVNLPKGPSDSSNLHPPPLCSTLSSVSCLTGQITREAKYRQRYSGNSTGDENCYPEGFITSLQFLPHQSLTLSLPCCYDNGQSPFGIAQASTPPSSAFYCSSSWPLVVTGVSHTNKSEGSMYDGCAFEIKYTLSLCL